MNSATQSLLLTALQSIANGTLSAKQCHDLANQTLKLAGAGAAPAVQPAPQASELVASIAGDTVLSKGPLTVYTDGACKGNPGPASWGVVILENGHVLYEGGLAIGKQTNQIAELSAAIAGLGKTPVGAIVELVSDSQYVLKGISEWRAGWERNNWLNSKKEPVANKAHWVKLFALVDARKVTTRWVKGHNGERWNERCDELANEALVEDI